LKSEIFGVSGDEISRFLGILKKNTQIIKKLTSKSEEKAAGVFEPIPSVYRLTTQKSLSERDLIPFCFS
jgi:hypothetical protein